MNKVLKKAITSLFTVILISCGSNQTEVADNQLSTGISPTTKSAEFAKTASSDVVVGLTKELGSYFNGQYANNPQALMGAQTTAGKQPVAAQAVAASNVVKDVYRFYNTNTGAHFFTMSVAERDYVKNTYPFFSYEGTKFFAYTNADPALSPVYRFYNNMTGTHFFTINAAEKDHVIAAWPTIFTYEGIAWYASTVIGTDLIPVYRFFNTRTGTHFYTASATEKDHIIATWNWFSFEGIAYYALQNAPVDPVVPPTAQSKLPDTGITSNQCYGTFHALISCTNPTAIALNNKQDGMIGSDVTSPDPTDGKLGFSYAEVPNFARTDCVQDKITGLMWEGKPTTGMRANTNTYTNYFNVTAPQKWSYVNTAFIPPTQAEVDAITNTVGYVAAVNASNLCGNSDWRLPTVEELQGIVDYGVAYPGPTVDAAWFPNTVDAAYLSSSRRFNDDSAWGVVFNDGIVSGQPREYGYSVRLVRGSINASQYTFSANGDEVTDAKTGLVWRRCAEGMSWNGSTCTGVARAYAHREALVQAKTQAAVTGVAWRLPNIKELSSIADKDKSANNRIVIDAVAFPVSPATYWSSTPVVTDSRFAWYVDYYGQANQSGRDGTERVRLVRSAP